MLHNSNFMIMDVYRLIFIFLLFYFEHIHLFDFADDERSIYYLCVYFLIIEII